MSDYQAQAKKFFEALERADWETVEGLLAEDFTCIGPVPSPITRDVWLDFQKAVRRAFPDWSYNLAELREEGNTIHASVHITATHSEELALPLHSLPPIAATGKHIELPNETAELLFSDGRISRMTTHSPEGGGAEGILQQLHEA